MRHNRTVTNGKWGVSVETSSQARGATLNVYQLLAGRRWPQSMFRYGQLNGKVFATSEEAFAAALEYGYCKTYSRNTCSFVQSRAARRRGYAAREDYRYENAAKRGGK